MRSFRAPSSRGQLKIQEMAFALVAFLIFFALVVIFYLSLKNSGGKEQIVNQREEEVLEALRKLADSPELHWSNVHEQCKGCIDLDKAVLLKEKERNEQTRVLWNMNSLTLELLSSSVEGECTLGNYPQCRMLTLVNASSSARIQNMGTFVALCWREQQERRCGLGKIMGSPKEVS